MKSKKNLVHCKDGGGGDRSTYLNLKDERRERFRILQASGHEKITGSQPISFLKIELIQRWETPQFCDKKDV